MPLDREYLESLGLEIAKRKYYNASKVESVITGFSERAAALESENASLRERMEALSAGREEIGDAILSAKTIARQLIAEAQEKADALLAAANREAGETLSAAKEKAEALLAEAEEKRRALLEDGQTREQKTIRGAQEAYLHLREQCLDAVKLLDGEWQRFLCSFADEPGEEGKLPDDLAERLGELAECLSDISGEGEAEQ